jgi:hypothetical protein
MHRLLVGVGSVLALFGIATAQKPLARIVPESGSAGFSADHSGLRHVEGSPQPFPLSLNAAGPGGSLIRENSVWGTFTGLPVVVEDFESGAFGGAWTTYSSTPNGRIQATGVYGTASGDYALVMDTTMNGTFNLNEAIWTVDLSGVPNPRLVFSQRSYGDEFHGFLGDFTDHFNADGVAISDDGVRWHPVLSAGGASFYALHEIDLVAQAAAAGMMLRAGFRIKFQQYDNLGLTSDGRGFDDIRIEVDGMDADTYAVTLDPGQKLTVRLQVAPELVGYLRVDRGNAMLAEAYGSAPGTTVLLQSIDTLGLLSGIGVGPQTYTLTAINANQARGSYALTATLNEELERESPTESTNDDVASAQDLSAALVPLLTSVRADASGRLPRRAAVRGTGGTKLVVVEDFESPALGQAWRATSSTPAGRIRVSGEAYPASGAYSLLMDTSTGSEGTTGAFYELFPAPGSLDLTANLTLQYQGSHYQVIPGTGTFHAPSSPSLTLDGWDSSGTGNWDDAHAYPIALPASWGAGFPYPGGVTSSITIGSNGYVYLQPSFNSAAFYNYVYGFLSEAPRLCAAFGDWDPSAGGSMHYDVGPNDEWVAITWLDVPEWPQPGTSVTFQMVLYRSGHVDFVYPGAVGMIAAPTLVGFSPGYISIDPGSTDISASVPFATLGSNASAPNRNEADWVVDLSEVSQPRLAFYGANWGDELHRFQGPFVDHFDADGVAISADGVLWYPLDVELYLGWGWQYFDIDLAQVAADANIALGASFHIRFQQYDNAPFPDDGIGWDLIQILGSDRDHYRIRLKAGESLALYAEGVGVDLEVLDADQVVVARRVRDPIVNGSFESGGFEGWEATTIGYPYFDWSVGYSGWGSLATGFDPIAPQHGYYTVLNSFDMYDSVGLPGPFEHTLAQNLTLPDPVPGLLRWSDRIQWDFTQWGNFASQPRRYDVELREPFTNALLANLHSFATGTQATTPTGNTGWQQHAADLSAFAGSTVRLVFRQTIAEVYTGPGQFELDRVAFDGIPENVDSFVPAFVAPNPGDYFLRVAAAGDYHVLALTNADFGLEDNDSLATARPTGGAKAAGRRWIVGHASTADVDPDWYRVRGTAGHTLVAETYTPGGGEGAYDNDLDPMLRLYDAVGNPIASDDNSARDGRNARLEHVFAATGDYYLSVHTITQVLATEGFESGVLGPQWSTSSTSTRGRIRVTDLAGAGDGQLALVMDVSSNSTTNNTNRATLTVDFPAPGYGKLRFAHANFNDEPHATDGVYINADGTSFFRIWEPPTQPFGVWLEYELDLAAEAASRNRTLGPGFQIRFQQTDNQTYPSDGRGWDAIEVVGAKAAGDYVLSIKGDG